MSIAFRSAATDGGHWHRHRHSHTHTRNIEMRSDFTNSTFLRAKVWLFTGERLAEAGENGWQPRHHWQQAHKHIISLLLHGVVDIHDNVIPLSLGLGHISNGTPVQSKHVEAQVILIRSHDLRDAECHRNLCSERGSHTCFMGRGYGPFYKLFIVESVIPHAMGDSMYHFRLRKYTVTQSLDLVAWSRSYRTCLGK